MGLDCTNPANEAADACQAYLGQAFGPAPNAALDAAFHVTRQGSTYEFWLTAYLFAQIAAMVIIFIVLFMGALRGFRGYGGLRAVLWGFVPAALLCALAAFISAFAWPLAIFIPFAFLGRVSRPAPVYRGSVPAQ